MKESTFEKYCLVIDEWFVNGFNQRQSYKKFYPEASDETADVEMVRILSIPKVIEYKEAKMKNKSEELNITLERQLKRLDDIINGKGKESDKINAIKEQNKLLALYAEHNSQKKPYSGMTPEQAKEYLKKYE